MNQWNAVPHRGAIKAPAAPPSAARMSRVIKIGLLAAVAMVALHALSQALDFSVFDLGIRAFNADKHDSVFGLASLLAQAAVAAASAWRGSGVEPRRRVWFALATLVGGLVFIRGLTTFNAVALALPLGCVLLLLCWLTWRDPTAVRKTVWAGLILMGLSLLLHKWGLAADTSTASDYTWAYQIIGIVKHGAELAGWILVATGLAAGSLVREARFSSGPVTLSGRRAHQTTVSIRALDRRARL